MADLEEQLQTFYQEIEDKNDLIRELKLDLYMTNKPMIPQVNQKQEKPMVESSSQTEAAPTSRKFNVFT